MAHDGRDRGARERGGDRRRHRPGAGRSRLHLSVGRHRRRRPGHGAGDRDAWTAIHTTGSFYDVDRFRRDPDDVRIDPWEREEVGDVAGKTLLHVQCHFGLDTLSWARLGATVTGVDFSEAAIGFARELADETGLAARSRFVLSNVYDLPEALAGESFDVVYTSRGTLGWLPDIDRWGEIVASFVKPGGVFYIHEGHPMLWVVGEDQP